VRIACVADVSARFVGLAGLGFDDRRALVSRAGDICQSSSPAWVSTTGERSSAAPVTLVIVPDFRIHLRPPLSSALNELLGEFVDLAGLNGPEIRIETVLGQQVVVGAALHH